MRMLATPPRPVLLIGDRNSDMALPRTIREQLLVERNPHAHSVVMSYLGIRRCLGWIALALPLVLGPIGYMAYGLEIQPNMSSYYHTPLRDVFVGSMCAMAVFLFCYHGYDTFENWTGNLASLSAVGVALFPLDPGDDPLNQSSIVGYIHIFCGGLFFTTLAVYSIFHFPRGHFGLRLKTKDQQRDGIYRAAGLTILGCMALTAIQLFWLNTEYQQLLGQWRFTFWMEWIAVWAFAISWLVKGQALLADSIDFL